MSEDGLPMCKKWAHHVLHPTQAHRVYPQEKGLMVGSDAHTMNCQIFHLRVLEITAFPALPEDASSLRTHVAAQGLQSQVIYHPLWPACGTQTKYSYP